MMFQIQHQHWTHFVGSWNLKINFDKILRPDERDTGPEQPSQTHSQDLWSNFLTSSKWLTHTDCRLSRHLEVRTERKR